MTWSIAARDPASGALGVAVASYATDAGRLVPYAKAGVGAVATQGLVNQAYGPNGLRLLEAGMSPEAAVQMLVGQDPGRDARQVHIVDANGRSAAFTGPKCLDWSGRLEAENVSVAGNSLTSSNVLSAALQAFKQAPRLPFVAQLLAALEAGAMAGGDRRGLRSAAIVISSPATGESLQIEAPDSRSPLEDLQRQLIGEPASQQQADGPQRSAERMSYKPPYDPFSYYSYFQPRIQQPDQRQQLEQMLTQRLMGQQQQPAPTTALGGVAQLAAGIGKGLYNYQQQGKQFPDAPGGASPSFGTSLANFFTGRNNGGLY
ncbi:hypothetical protein BTR14_03125 [Rhizobium rhizosphaerae]|uniref:DUF1028 domain-containing protein n=1 Tax=Xaviernesmea rhizosphaerae TaxID=1672749 RepID=A0ABX3PHF8_9HYPH|nr:DUF1028 domain-containing protein [Xaviernesmea rhizosphaerae]OQP87576.1 hypothetical protein BTR14_03125 [Xaviernesmea rhizosphaerae]